VPFADVLPGDVMIVHLKDGNKHVAIIAKIEAGKFEMLHQNVGGKREVIRGTNCTLDQKKGNRVIFYRAVPYAGLATGASLNQSWRRLMPIRFACPSCQAKQCADDHLAGRTLRCLKCRSTFVVPAAGKPPAPGPNAPVADPKLLLLLAHSRITSIGRPCRATKDCNETRPDALKPDLRLREPFPLEISQVMIAKFSI
jgi:hypothetical protein